MKALDIIDRVLDRGQDIGLQVLKCAVKIGRTGFDSLRIDLGPVKLTRIAQQSSIALRANGLNNGPYGIQIITQIRFRTPQQSGTIFSAELFKLIKTYG